MTPPASTKLTHCPVCRNPLVVSGVMVPGFTCYACRTCRKVAVDVPGTTMAWRPGGEGAVEKLRMEAERESTWQRALHAGEVDPKTGKVAEGDEAWDALEGAQWL